MEDAPQNRCVGLTPRQRDCLLIIQELTDKAGGVSPSYSEIQAELGLASKSRVFDLIKALAMRGYVRFLVGHARSITILQRVLPSEEPVFTGRFRDPDLAAEWAEAERRFGTPASAVGVA